jgi:predicted PurR-regulated permease PerM
MNLQLLETISIVSLSVLSLTLFALLICLIPIISQVTQLLNSLNLTVKVFNDGILPNLTKLSEILGKVKKAVDSGQNFGDKIGKSANAFSAGIKAGVKSYFNKEAK